MDKQVRLYKKVSSGRLRRSPELNIMKCFVISKQTVIFVIKYKPKWDR